MIPDIVLYRPSQSQEVNVDCQWMNPGCFVVLQVSVTRQLFRTATMSWTRFAKSRFSSVFRTRPVRALRQFSIQGSPSSTQHSLRTLLFTSLTAGLVGFTIAKSIPSLGHESESSQFGSSDDFKKAIQELRSTFPGNDKVSVDPDDLQVHGFSANDHHPGM